MRQRASCKRQCAHKSLAPKLWQTRTGRGRHTTSRRAVPGARSSLLHPELDVGWGNDSPRALRAPPDAVKGLCPPLFGVRTRLAAHCVHEIGCG
eukprot:4406760-Prymnesium_polylepis.1